MSLKMTKDEREAFLAEPHIGVFAHDRDRPGPSAAPIWYLYTPGGEVEFLIDSTSRKARFLDVGSPVTLVAQREALPPAYVSVEGVINSIDTDPPRAFVERLYRHYLDGELAEQRIQMSLDSDLPSMILRMQPQHWHTVDLAKDPQAAELIENQS